MPAIKRWFAESTNPERRPGGPQRRHRGRRPVHRALRRARDARRGARRRWPTTRWSSRWPTRRPRSRPRRPSRTPRIIATGRSDYPNQINNVLCFPGIFRGALDVRAPRDHRGDEDGRRPRHRRRRPRRRAARGLHHPLAVQPRRRRRRSPPRWPSRPRARAPPRPIPARDRLRAGRHRSPSDLRRARSRPHEGSPSPAATGRIGSLLVDGCRSRGDEVTILSRARRAGASACWDPMAGPAPAEALAGRDAVVHLAGEDVAQRWTDDAQAAHPRVARDRHPQPRRGHRARPSRARGVLVSASAVGYYGDRAATSGSTRTRRPATTSSPRSAWPGSARPQPPRSSALRVVRVRTGVVLDRQGGALREDAAAVPARRRRPGGRRQAVRCPGSTSTTSSASTSPPSTATRWRGPVNATAPAAGDQQGVLQGARPRAAPAGDRARARRSRSRRSTARWPRSSPRASAPCPARAARARATPSGTPTSTRRCARRCGRLTTAQGRAGKVGPWRPRAARIATSRSPGCSRSPASWSARCPPGARKRGRLRRRDPARGRRRRARPRHPRDHRRPRTSARPPSARQEREHRARATAELQAELRLREGRGEAARGLEGAEAIAARQALRRRTSTAPSTPTPAAACGRRVHRRASNRVECERFRARRGEDPALDLGTAHRPLRVPGHHGRRAASSRPDASSIGYPYRALVHFGSGRFTLLQDQRPPRRGLADARVPGARSDACGGTAALTHRRRRPIVRTHDGRAAPRPRPPRRRPRPRRTPRDRAPRAPAPRSPPRRPSARSPSPRSRRPRSARPSAELAARRARRSLRRAAAAISRAARASRWRPAAGRWSSTAARDPGATLLVTRGGLDGGEPLVHVLAAAPRPDRLPLRVRLRPARPAR